MYSHCPVQPKGDHKPELVTPPLLTFPRSTTAPESPLPLSHPLCLLLCPHLTGPPSSPSPVYLSTYFSYAAMINEL